jgi:ATP-dependent Clp protease ATP-binding subunit ClpC
LFERYTERLRRVILCAREEASGFGRCQIEPEDLLLGLLREDKLLAKRFVGSAESVGSIRGSIAREAPTRRASVTADDLPLSHASKRLLAYAAEESVHLDQRRIGTEHLLIGLFREEGTLAATILSDLGLRVEALRQEYRSKGR